MRTQLLTLAWSQGIYFAVTGIWPLFSIRTFELVTGPKTDDWLVKTVGALILVISAVLIQAGLRRRMSVETVIAGAGSAVVLLLVDVVYSLRGVISYIYLADAALEVVFACAWIWLSRRNSPRDDRR